MATSYVVDGATLKCSKGGTCKLKVAPGRKTFIQGKPQANVNDYTTKSIPKFNFCSIPRHHQCRLSLQGPWKSGKNDVIIEGASALMHSSKIKCAKGGVISIEKHNQCLESDGAVVLPVTIPNKLKADSEKPTSQESNQSNKIEKFVSIAKQELKKGFKENNSDNKNPYGKWYKCDGQPWCAIFVSWCANEAGILNTIVPKYHNCENGKNLYLNKGKYKNRASGYKPKAGDIVFFNNFHHTGIIIAYDKTTNIIYTIEGNSSDSVKQRHYKLDNTYVDGFGLNDGNSYGTIPESSTSGLEKKIL